MAVAVLLGGVAFAATGGAGIGFRVTAPVTVQALGLDVGHPAVGQMVTAGAKVVAERRFSCAAGGRHRGDWPGWHAHRFSARF